MTSDQQNVLDGFLSHRREDEQVEVTEVDRLVRIDITRPWGGKQTAVISPEGRLDWTTPVIP